MSLSPQRPVKTLPEWLDIATRELVPSAQDRIRAEIEAHYAEAVAVQLKNGLLESAAQAAALSDLGDAHAAARRFRRKHLTEKNIKQIAQWMRYARSKTLLAFWFLLGAFYVWFIPPPSDVHDWYAGFRSNFELLLWLILIATRIAVYLLATRKTTPAIMRRIFWLNLVCILFFLVPTLSELLVGMVLFLHRHLSGEIGGTHETDFNTSLDQSLQILFFFVWLASMTLNLLQLRQKLQSDGEDWNELPPRDAMAS